MSLKKKPKQTTTNQTTTLGQSLAGSNDNEGVFHILQISRTGSLPLDTV